MQLVARNKLSLLRKRLSPLSGNAFARIAITARRLTHLMQNTLGINETAILT